MFSKKKMGDIGEPIRVLCVDDDSDFVVMTGQFLERKDEQIEAVTETSVRDGLDRLADEDIDCIVSDYNMPGRNGLEFLEHVRNEYPDLPFFLFTGKGSEEIASEAISVGVTDYLQKDGSPEQYEILVNRIRNAVARTRAQRQRQRHERQFKAVFSDPHVLVGILDPDGTLRKANETAMTFIDADRADVIGSPFWETPWWLDEMRSDVRRWVTRAAKGEYVEFQADLERPSGEIYSTTGMIRPVTTDAEEVVSLVVSAREITERKRRERAIEDLHETTQRFVEADTKEEVAEMAVEAASDILQLPASGIRLYDETKDELIPVTWTSRTEELVDEFPTILPGEGIVGKAFETGETLVSDDVSSGPAQYTSEISVRSQIAMPLEDYGVLIIGSSESEAFDDTDISLVETLGTHVTAALTRIEREQELQRSQERYRELVENFPDGGVFLYDENLTCLLAGGRGLSDVGLSPEEIEGERPRDRYPDAIAEELELHLKNAFEGEHTEFEQTYQGRHYRIRVLPIGEDPITHVMAVSQDITQRKEQERDMQRQNERLDDFASVVSHDLRNPLNVAQGQLEMAREECDSEHLDRVADAVDRSLTLLEDLFTLAREGKYVSEFESVDLAEITERCWRSVSTTDGTLILETDQTIQADESRLRQLLENLIRNAVEHGGDDVTVTIGDLGDGFYVADDGPGIPPDERDDVFKLGYSTTNEGTGFGLNIVQEIAHAHEWNVRVTRSENGGACFEFTNIKKKNIN